MFGSISKPQGIRPFRFGAGIGAIGGDTYRRAVVNTGPVGYWRLGEASGTVAHDEMGANNGAYVGSPTLGVAGLLTGDSDTAVTLDGATQLIRVPAAGAFNIGDVGTMAMWINGGSNNYLMSRGNQSMALDLSATGHLQLTKSNVADMVASTIAVGAGNHFVAGTKNGADLHLYIDGVDVTGVVTNATCGNPIFDLTIGSDIPVGTPNNFYTGILDEPAIWNRALSPAEIAMLNAIGRGTW